MSSKSKGRQKIQLGHTFVGPTVSRIIANYLLGRKDVYIQAYIIHKAVMCQSSFHVGAMTVFGLATPLEWTETRLSWLT